MGAAPYARAKRAAALAAVLALALAAAGAPQEPAATIRATTRLVTIDVVATDRDGRVVGDLRQDEFTVLEDGKPQAIAVFAREHGAPAPPPPPSPLPAGVYTNRPEYNPDLPTVLVLFDVLNTPRADRAYARDRLLDFVQHQPPGQKIGILALTSRLLVLQEPTTDRRLLVEAARRFALTVRAPHASQPEASDVGVDATTAAEAAAIARMVASLREISELEAVDRGVRALDALRSILAMTAGYRGRKVLVWLSGSFPLRPARVENERGILPGIFKRTMNALADAQLAIYPVDARGLASLDAMDAANVPRDAFGRALGGAAMAGRGLDLRADFRQAQETMREVAAQTGGRAYLNRNDLDRAIAAAIADGATYYTLAYYPASSKWDGAFRQVEVRVARHDVQLRHRRGYYALEPGSPPPEGDPAGQLRSNPLPARAVTFAGRVRARPEGPSVELAVDLPTLTSEPLPGGKRRLRCRLFAVSFSGDDQPLQQAAAAFSPEFSAEKYRELLETGLFLRVQLPADARARYVRVAVKDEGNGSVGTLRIPLEPR